MDFSWEIHADVIYRYLPYYIYIYICIYLVGGLEDLDYFFHSVGNVIIPTDELIFFHRGSKTTNQYIYIYIHMYTGIALDV